MRHNPLQFKVTGIMTLCWDFGELSYGDSELTAAVLGQRLYYGAEPPTHLPLHDRDHERLHDRDEEED